MLLLVTSHIVRWPCWAKIGSEVLHKSKIRD